MPRDARRAAAHAEGRRQRRVAARRRRSLVRRSMRAVHRRPMLQLLLLPIVALLITGMAAAIAASLAFLVFVGMVAGPVLLVGGTTFAVVRHRRRRTIARVAAAPPWADARARFAALATEYTAYECDPMAVLHRPALSDVRVPSTARFVDAFSHAQALDTDAHPGDGHATQFVVAVDGAERAWHAAREAADRIRLSGLSADERASVERVIKLLTVARDSGHEAERLAAYARARSELARLDAAGVVHVPGLATAALDRAARGALPA